ncbi:MAG: carboxypeptidase [Gammaproteobacteria bacterium]|nr:carboxypeptidase [Gammaproteobacteria bacterium]
MKKIIALLVSMTLSTGLLAQDDMPKDAPEAKTSVTQQTARVGGKNIRYTVTAGTMLMKNDKDEPTALFGYTAYVADGGNRSDRPIMFAYNGGPGSASIWLHMGILGPQRAVVTDAGWSDNGPYRRVNNEYSIIDEVDLVMIDPVGTGFSKPVGVGKGEDFWGVDQDIKSVSEFIVQYLTENKRWASPKYILGESYGGIRSGGVAYYLLNNHMVALNGVVLVSPFMEFATGFAGMGIDLPHVMFLPTFASTANYHGALANKHDDLPAFMAEVADFALNEYAPALLMGSRLSAEKRREVIAGLSRYTGLSEEYWDRADMRISEGQFSKELSRETGVTIGRVDSRFSGNMINRLGESMNYDPMTTSIGPGYLAAFMDYYQNDLGVADVGNYTVFGNVFGAWDWSHAQPDLQGFKLPIPNTAIDLEHTMQQNPSMRVLVQQGYYDLATPHLATEYFIDHLEISDELRDNIEVAYYEAGHMMYIHEPSMKKFKDDLARFVRGGDQD